MGSLFISAKQRAARDNVDIAVAFRQIELWAQPQTVRGAKGGNAALASLIDALVALGLVKDETT